MLELCGYFRRTVKSRTTKISEEKSVTSVLNNLNKDKYNISTIELQKNDCMVSVQQVTNTKD